MSVESKSVPLGVCVLPKPGRNSGRTVSHPDYVHEILAHAGLCCSAVGYEDLIDRLAGVKILVTVGEAALPDEAQTALRSWTEAGGAWISVGGVCGMADVFGVEVESPAQTGWGGGAGMLGEGYLVPEERSHPMLAHVRIPLHFFNGVTVRAARGKVLARVVDAHQRPGERVAVSENALGEGRCVLIAPDVTGSVVRIQQGIAVTRDGLPAPDGSAPICDEVLKSDDGAVLDWIFDRSPLPGVPGLNLYLEPIADQWRELVLRSIFYVAEARGVALPVLWLYPRNLPALAHLSHDTDSNDPAMGRAMLEVLERAGINSTWCVLPPGYPENLIGEIREAGHELATHLDAMSNGTVFSREEFDRQHRQLVELFGGERPVTNKNHYLRWEGDTEFLDWLEEWGIALDQSKGVSKTGEAGFNFGACQPYFPVAPDGRVIDVLEMPTVTQDLGVFIRPEFFEPYFETVLRHHGVAHLLHHPSHIVKPGVADALLAAIERAKAAGAEWWTARRVSDWERARRKVAWSDYADSPPSVRLATAEPLEGATILWLAGAGGRITVNGREVESVETERWGFRFRAVTFDAGAGSEHELSVE